MTPFEGRCRGSSGLTLLIFRDVSISFWNAETVKMRRGLSYRIAIKLVQIRCKEFGVCGTPHHIYDPGENDKSMNKHLRRRGFTLVEIMIVVLIIGILMAIAVPNFITARETSRRNSCIATLKQIDGAKEQWAMDNKLPSGTACQMSDIAGVYMKGPLTGPTCPTNGVYTINPVGTTPTCSLSAAPDLHVLP